MLSEVAIFVVAWLATAAAQGLSFPTPITGTPNCLLPIRQLRCTADNRSGFVAGMQYGPGPGYGLRAVCSRGATTGRSVAASYYTETVQQTTWDMTDLNDPHFPKNMTGEPNLAYYFPLGALITQMIVLEAANPLGDSFGVIPALIFRYYTPDTAALGFAVCGNNRYAQAYLNPFPASDLPPTMPTLQSVYVSPLSASTPAFLASFQGTCSNRGFGFLGGDPQTQSVYHVQSLQKVCFAPATNVTDIDPTPSPEERPEVSYNWDAPQARCYWDKRNSATSPSVSCARTGAVVATGKYGVLMVDSQLGGAVQAIPDRSGKFMAVNFSGPMYQGSSPGLSIAQ